MSTKEPTPDFMSRLTGVNPNVTDTANIKVGSGENRVINTTRSRIKSGLLVTSGLSLVALIIAFQEKVIEKVRNQVHPSSVSKQIPDDEKVVSVVPNKAEAFGNVQNAFIELGQILSEENPDPNVLLAAIERLKHGVQGFGESAHHPLITVICNKVTSGFEELPNTPATLSDSQHIQELRTKLESSQRIWEGVSMFLPKNITAPLESLKNAKDTIANLGRTLLRENPNAADMKNHIEAFKKAVEEVREIDANPILSMVKPLLDKKLEIFENIWNDSSVSTPEKIKKLQAEILSVQETLEKYVP